MLFDAGKAAVHRAHDAELAIERLRVLAQRGRVLVQNLPLLSLNALDIGYIGAHQPELLEDQICRFVRHN